MRAGRHAIFLSAGLCLGLLVLSACDEMTRFRHEKYSCDANPAGLIEVVFNSQKVGSEAQLEQLSGSRTLPLIEASDQFFVLQDGTLRMQIDRQTGEIILTEGTRFFRLACTRSVFTM